MGKSIAEAVLGQLGRQSVNRNSFCLLYDEIGPEAAKEVSQYVLEANYGDPDERPECLNLLISSGGGCLASGFAIIDIMASSSIPIRTIGLGQIASAALMIFMAGSKGQRILTPNTSILSHRWTGGSYGKEHELFAIAKEFDLTNARMLDHYVASTGLKKEAVMKYLLPPQDVFLTAEEAVRYKIADKIGLVK